MYSWTLCHVECSWALVSWGYRMLPSSPLNGSFNMTGSLKAHCMSVLAGKGVILNPSTNMYLCSSKIHQYPKDNQTNNSVLNSISLTAIEYNVCGVLEKTVHTHFDLRIMTCNNLQVVRAADVIVHPLWDGNIGNGFDLALFRLSEPVKDILCPLLAHQEVNFHQDSRMETLGWGEQHRLHGRQEVVKLDKLQVVNLKIVSHSHCPPGVKRFLNDHMVCTFTQDLHPYKGEKGEPGKQHPLLQPLHSLVSVVSLLLVYILLWCEFLLKAVSCGCAVARSQPIWLGLLCFPHSPLNNVRTQVHCQMLLSCMLLAIGTSLLSEVPVVV